MNKKLCSSLILSLFIGLGLQFCGLQTAYCQTAKRLIAADKAFADAVNLFEKEKYASAQRQFRRYMAWDSYTYEPQAKREVAEFCACVSSARLYNKGADVDLKLFLDKYPISHRRNRVYAELAQYLYFYKRYEEACLYFEKVNIGELEDENLAEDIRFHYAYAAFSCKDYEKAKDLFSKINQEDSKFKSASSYYYAYILYTEGRYQSAFNEFAKIAKDEDFAPILPYYILQIYYMQGKYDSVIAVGEDLIAVAKAKRYPEIARLLGEAYYRAENYDTALYYMNEFFEKSASLPDAEALYILSYIYYRKEAYDTAAEYFQKLLEREKDSELSQSAYYHLAHCYTKLGKHSFAMESFRSASRLNQNRIIQEDAHFNYAKSIRQLGLAPYKDAINAFESFVENYPKSVYLERIYEYMSEVYTKDKDYEAALKAINSMSFLPVTVVELKQTILFNMAVELFKKKDYKKALEAFVESESLNYNEKLSAKALFWQGECYYAMDVLDRAEELFKSFWANKEAKDLEEYSTSIYSMAYLNMDNVAYDRALGYFEKYLGEKNIDSSLYFDALLRAGDCSFMLSKFGSAENYYTKAIAALGENKDYAVYQRALAVGASGNFDKKIKYLEDFILQYPQSYYQPMAINEIAASYIIKEEDNKALFYYDRIMKEYPRHDLCRNAALKKGLIYFNASKNKEALDAFKYVVSKYPSSTEARQALINIRNIYISMNKAEEFFAYTSSLSNIKIEDISRDTIAYMAAEARYAEGDCEGAIEGFRKYTEMFPKGIFIAKAWYYIGECAFYTSQDSLALEAYLQLANEESNEYTDKALDRAAFYLYKNKDYERALGLYNRMIANASASNIENARIGRIRAYYNLSKDKYVIDAVEAYLRLEGVDEANRQEAVSYAAAVAEKQGDRVTAKRMYELLLEAKDASLQARAKFYIMNLVFESGDLDKTEERILDYISNPPMDDYYLARVYILWADVYAKRGNDLQARQTLESIVENYEGEDLLNLAKEKIRQLEEKESDRLEREEVQRSEYYDEGDDISVPRMPLVMPN